MTGVGLDPSWMAASSWAARAGLVFGSEFVFTSGPLSILFHRQFDDGQAVASIITWVMFCLLAAWVVVRAGDIGSAGTGRFLAAAALTLAVFVLTPFPIDSLFFIAALLLVVHARQVRPDGGPDGWADGLVAVLLSVLLAALSLAKFSVLPLAVLVVFAADGVRAGRRQWPLASVVFAIAILCLFVASGGAIGDFLPFLAASLDVATGYTAAMSLTGSVVEVLAWCLAALLFVLVAMGERRAGPRASFWLVILALSAYLWFCFKSGFVRHDLHVVTAWAGLSAAALFWAMGSLGRQRALVTALYAVIAIGTGLQARIESASLHAPFSIIERSVAQVQAASAFIRSPSAWLAARQQAKEAAFAQIRSAAPLPALRGSVDMIPSAQSEVIAHGLDYRPRPTVQEYTTYSASLIARNSAFYSGDRAPDHVIFQPGSIDDRHPASAEGPLWPILLSRYQPTELVRDYVLLSRRPAPLPALVGETQTVTVRLGDTVVVPQGSAPLMGFIDVRPSLLGRLASLLFKTPELYLEATYRDGHTERYRFVPAIHREGILIAPLVRTSTDFAALASGFTGSSPGIWPISLRMTGRRLHAWFVDEEVTFRFAPLDLAALRQAAQGSAIAAAIGERQADLSAALAGLRSDPPRLVAAPEGIFAHAPARIELATDGATALIAAFGIRPWAYLTGNTDGVCFAIRDAATNAGLFERCLDPAREVGDRTGVEHEIALPAGTTRIVAETTCRATCAYDWSYWRRLRPVHR